MSDDKLIHFISAKQAAVSIIEDGARKRSDGTSAPMIRGYGAVFNQFTEINDFFGSFREQIAPGAFSKVLRDGQDVRGLFNHDSNFPLGRVSNQTLILREDDNGLLYECYPASNPMSDSVVSWVREGYVSGSSFSFIPGRMEWSFSDDDGDDDGDELTVIEVERMLDTGPVTFPAYEQTSATVRSNLLRVYKEARAKWEGKQKIVFPVSSGVLTKEARAQRRSFCKLAQYRSADGNLVEQLMSRDGKYNAFSGDEVAEQARLQKEKEDRDAAAAAEAARVAVEKDTADKLAREQSEAVAIHEAMLRTLEIERLQMRG